MFGVTILGNNSALPSYDRHPTSQVITLNDRLFLFDCGEGTQMQMNRYKIKRSRINHIFISHLHGDHYFGLAGLLTSYALSDRNTSLHIYAPKDLELILKLQVTADDSRLPYQLFFHPLQQQQQGLLVEDAQFSVSCFPVYHRIDAWGFLIKEKRKPRKINAEKIKEFAQLPTEVYEQLQNGKDVALPGGILLNNEAYTYANTPPKSYAYCADTIFTPSIAQHIQGATMIYHEATYLNDQLERATRRHHSTAAQAAEMAKLAGAEKLLIGHFSSQYENERLYMFEQEARLHFSNAELAIEGVTYEV